MAYTPDQFPGVREDEGLILTPGSDHPTQNGETRYVDGEGFKFYEASVEHPLYTDARHSALRQLIHLADGSGPYEGFASGAYREVTGTVFPSAVIWYDSAGVGKKKIVEKLITYTGPVPTTIVWKAYDATETLLVTVTDTITYSGVFETSRTRAIA